MSGKGHGRAPGRGGNAEGGETRDRFWRKLWQGTAPLVLWASHFFFCYLYAAAACGHGTRTITPWSVLAGATVLALGAAAWLLYSACSAWRAARAEEGSESPRSLLHMARLGGAVLALAAIAWGALPLLAFGGC